MDRDALLKLTEDLAREMKRLAMSDHVKLARTFYAELQGGKPHTAWTADTVKEMAARLRVPPMHERYEVRERTAKCSQTRPGHHAEYTGGTFPGGFLSVCSCGERWLALDGIGLPK